MLIKTEQQGSRGGEKFEDVFVNTKALNIASEIEILKSRPLMQRVVDSLNLQFSYYGKGKVKTVNIYKQGPFLVNALELADSSRGFSFNVKFVNANEFRINDEKKTFTFGQLFKNSNGVFRLIQTPYSAANNDYSAEWKPSSAAAAEYAFHPHPHPWR